jgi:hypothetical protein
MVARRLGGIATLAPVWAPMTTVVVIASRRRRRRWAGLVSRDWEKRPVGMLHIGEVFTTLLGLAASLCRSSSERGSIRCRMTNLSMLETW